MSTTERTYELTADEFVDASALASIALMDAIEAKPVRRDRLERCLRVARMLDAKFGIGSEPWYFAEADRILAGAASGVEVEG